MKRYISILLIICFIFTAIILPVFASDYILAPSDQLEVKILNQKDLDTKQSVAPDGTISLPFVGRLSVQGQTLSGLDKLLNEKFSKYVNNPQVVVYLIPRPIYVIQKNVRTETWDVKEAKSINEAKALAGVNYTENIKHGDVISVEAGDKPDFWEKNWYKVLTGTAVLVGIYATVKK